MPHCWSLGGVVRNESSPLLRTRIVKRESPYSLLCATSAETQMGFSSCSTARECHHLERRLWALLRWTMTLTLLSL